MATTLRLQYTDLRTRLVFGKILTVWRSEQF